MQRDFTPAQGGVMVLAWIGGITVLVILWQAFVPLASHVLVLPLVLLQTVANINPRDISNEQLAIGYIAGATVLGVVGMVLWDGGRALLKKVRH